MSGAVSGRGFASCRKRHHSLPRRVLARLSDGRRTASAEAGVGARLVLIDAGKMSKSKGNVVQPRPIAQCWEWTRCVYYMLRETVFGQDGNFSYDALVQRYNSDLANGLGI